ncbi:Riboflavin biosynthesis protein RibD [Mucisphaera calidilacus]|uniref:Riboflavin biosynthesis protein RibD n=2 Tax=Mucisphaera calidilacus TaxID=2527982 RepID=A0A518C0U5_9BACT|nr:Riboflavin biosynthesis protein RibD [Mucisphaera calidilacus]
MARALALAARGEGFVEPNPMVGAVLVRDGQLLGEGWHRRFGGRHAEVEALADADRRGLGVRGATCYVTLEPCSHHGKTGPCADALIEAGVGCVVAAMEDPHVAVSGGGFAKLRDAGVEVAVGDGELAARRLNRWWVKRLETGLPWVIAKWAQTVDGKVATRTGDSQWISNEDSRRRVHELRGRVDAVMVGVGTAIADDPTLTARGVEVRREACRVVVDPNGRLPAGSKLLTDGGPAVEVVGDPEAGLRKLVVEREASNVLVEGGPRLVGSMLDAGLVDELWVFVGPKILGDHGGMSAAWGAERDLMPSAHALVLESVERVSGDVLLRYAVGG